MRELKQTRRARARWMAGVLAGACAVLPPAGGAGQDGAQAAPIPDFPAGFDWPADPARIEQGIARADWPLLRTHAWHLWAGINTAGRDGKPLWWDWPTSTPAFANPDAHPAPPVAESSPGHPHGLRHRNRANTPIELDGPVYTAPVVKDGKCGMGTLDPNGNPVSPQDGTQFQSNGDIMIAGVVYNREAYQWIRQQSLYKADTLTAAWKKGEKNLAPFPARSIVLKHMYWPARGDGPTALPVWHPERYPVNKVRYIGYEFWKDTVAIDVSGKPLRPGARAQVDYLYYILESDKKTRLPTLRRKVPLVPVERFYHRRIDAAELARMGGKDQAILNASACWLYNRPFQAGDYLVSVAMHINTKEVPDWALQSVWWSDTPDQGRFAADRPAIAPEKAPGPWRHYLLTLDYGIETGARSLPVAYNPYIELAAGHPIQTSCRNCHTRAAWPPHGFTGRPVPSVLASYLAQGGPGPLADIKPDDPIFKELMRVDFQWAVSDRAK